MYDMHVFDCLGGELHEQPERWDGCWIRSAPLTGHTELLIKGRGSNYTVILGTCSMGNYLSIPGQRVSCPLSHLSDTFWNYGQLSVVLGESDAVTITTALADFEKHKRIN